MKTIFILHLCILISLVLVVRCDEEGDGVIGDGLGGDLGEEGNDGDGLGNGFGAVLDDGTYTGTGEKIYFNYKCLGKTVI